MKGLRDIRDFELRVPAQHISGSKSQAHGEYEILHATVLTANHILTWPETAQTSLYSEVETLFCDAFPMMPREGLEEFISHYFWQATNQFQTQTILIKNSMQKIVATTLFYYGAFTYGSQTFSGVYIHGRAVIPAYQHLGLGRVMSQKILTELQPDLLLTTCAQSSSVYSWTGLCRKKLITGYEVYPRLEYDNGNERLVTVPYKDLDFAIHAFRQLFLVGVAEGKPENVHKALQNLTIFLTRKRLGMKYDFDPWCENGREDALAKALGVTSDDAIVVMFRKIENGGNE